MAEILNAAPMVIDQGTRDLSTRVVPASPLEIPQHLPKIYIFAEKGPVGPNYMDLEQASLTQVYGDETFNVNGPYYTHQTALLQAVASAGNNCVVHRLDGSDPSDYARVVLYLDMVETRVPVYEKAPDGSIMMGVEGEPVLKYGSDGEPVSTWGHKVAWVARTYNLGDDDYYEGPGKATSHQGTIFDPVTEEQSYRYPIFEFYAATPGVGGNKIAIKLQAAQESDQAGFPSHILNDGKMFPFYFGMTKVVNTTTGKTNAVLNSFGAQQSRFVAKPLGVDPASGAIIDLAKVIKDQYVELPASMSTDLGGVYIYENNLKHVLTSLYQYEKNVEDPFRDSAINNTEENIYAINFLSFTNSNGSPYVTVQVVDTESSVRLTKNTNVFLTGGWEGAMNEAVLDNRVIEDMDNYNNPLHEYNDLVLHPESIIYDSGFSLEAKKQLAKFIARRKDTFVVLGTYSHPPVNVPPPQEALEEVAGGQTLADQYSVGVALKTMMELYPESATFGTPVMRAMIVGGSGEIINSLYTKRVPLTYEVAYKAARYMGAKNGAWKNGFSFDRAPGSVVTQLKNIDVTWVPASTRNTMWSVGVNFVLNYKIRTQFFPALQTVYENDTSVLNSFFTAVAISYLNKIQHAAWREFSGSISLTNAQLEEAVNTFVSNQVKDKFDGKFVVIPNATVTELDAVRGYSWSLPVQIYANTLRTVMTAHVEALRRSDLQE